MPTLKSRLVLVLSLKSLWYSLNVLPDDYITHLSQYLIMNLGMSENFGFVDVDNLPFPSTMRVDYVRVYQDPDSKNWGCDPDDFPTAAYINE